MARERGVYFEGRGELRGQHDAFLGGRRQGGNEKRGKKFTHERRGRKARDDRGSKQLKRARGGKK